MSRPGVLLTEEAGRWTVQAAAPGGEVRRVAASEDDPSRFAVEVADLVDELSLSPGRVVLAIGSVLFATLPDRSPTDRTARTYLLEDSLPLDAEQIVADFCGSDLVAAVAVDGDRFGPLVESLEEAGLRVQSVVPSVLVTMQQLLARRDVRSAQPDCLVWPGANSVELVRFENERPIDWRQLPLDGLAAAIRLGPPIGSALVVESDGSPPLSDDLIASETTRRIRLAGDELPRAAAKTIAMRLAPWFELRRGPLAAGDPNRRLAAAWATLSVVVTAALLLAAALIGWSTLQLNGTIADHKAEQDAAYERAFGPGNVPRAAMRQLTSKLRAARLAASEPESVPQATPAMTVLAEALAGLPDGVRTRIDDIRVAGDAVTLAVELRSHDDAGRVAAGLDAAGFEVVPPTTTQTDSGSVRTSIRASRQADEPAEGDGP